MELFILLLILSIPLRFLAIYLKNKNKHKKHHSNNNPKEIETQETIDFTGKYQKTNLLTKNEWYEYKKLKQLAESKELQICPKVRLLDLIEPRREDPKFKTLFYKIQAKHVDFVICDQNLHVKAILELDDNSHNQADRKERDEFVDLILKDVGYTVIRTRSITENTLDLICP